MKLIIIHENETLRQIISKQVRDQWHVVVEQKTVANLLPALVRHQPHAVLIEDIGTPSVNFLRTAWPQLLPDTKLFWIPSKIAIKNLKRQIDGILDEAARAAKQPRPLQPYTSETRTILHDDAYRQFASPGKLNLPAAPDTVSLLSQSEDFSLQVRTALRNHSAALRYLRQVMVTDKGQRVETAYRFVHGSYKIYALRESIGRWAGVLLHYFPQIDLEHLPPPCALNPGFEFIEWKNSPELTYALVMLMSYPIDPEAETLLARLGKMQFEGQSPLELAENAVYLSGLNAFMREIAIAQVRFMSEILNPNSAWHLSTELSRKVHRAEGIFLDFWAYGQLRINPEHLRQTAAEALEAGPTEPGDPLHFYFHNWEALKNAEKVEENK